MYGTATEPVKIQFLFELMMTVDRYNSGKNHKNTRVECNRKKVTRIICILTVITSIIMAEFLNIVSIPATASCTDAIIFLNFYRTVTFLNHQTKRPSSASYLVSIPTSRLSSRNSVSTTRTRYSSHRPYLCPTTSEKVLSTTLETSSGY